MGNNTKFLIEDPGILFSLYWNELMNQSEIAVKLNTSLKTISRAMRRLNIPIRSIEASVKLSHSGGRWLSNHKNPYWVSYAEGKQKYEHIQIMENQLKRSLWKKERVHHKDFIGKNNHPINLELTLTFDHPHKLHKNKILNRIPMYEIYMRMAEQIAMRSTCIRMKTGSVIVSGDLKKVYSLGFNGTVKGWVNSCNGIEGQCGCIHSEENALLKLGVEDSKKILFCTSGPCMNCAKKLIQSGFSDVFYRSDYRDKKPIVFLHYHGIRTCKYDLYKEHIWD